MFKLISLILIAKVFGLFQEIDLNSSATILQQIFEKNSKAVEFLKSKKVNEVTQCIENIESQFKSSKPLDLQDEFEESYYDFEDNLSQIGDVTPPIDQKEFILFESCETILNYIRMNRDEKDFPSEVVQFSDDLIYFMCFRNQKMKTGNPLLS